MTSARDDMPEVVTFETGAQLLMDLGIVERINGDAVRYIARTRKNWPFGEGRTYSYGKVSNARTMAAKPFVRYFEEHPPTGRGPDKRPRKKRGAS